MPRSLDSRSGDHSHHQRRHRSERSQSPRSRSRRERSPTRRHRDRDDDVGSERLISSRRSPDEQTDEFGRSRWTSDNRGDSDSRAKDKRDRSPRRIRSERDRGRSRSRDRNESNRRDRKQDRSSERRRSDKKRRKEKKQRRSTKSRSHSPVGSDDMDVSAAIALARSQREFTTYTNVDNPFNDANLEQKFVWNKKTQRESESGLSSRERERRERERREEARLELEKLNKRRQEREQERILREEEQIRMQRESDLAMMGDWEAKEVQFHLEQAKKRAEIRIREGRAKPIDILAVNIRLVEERDDKDDEEEDTQVEVDLEEPYTIFENLDLKETDELQKDIQYYLSLEKNETNKRFWQALLVVCDDELSRLRGSSNGDGLRVGSGSSSVVEADVQAILANKNIVELDSMQEQIKRKLAGTEPVDVDFWERVLKALVVAKAKAKLKEMHQEMLMKRLERLRELQRRQVEKSRLELESSLARRSDLASAPKTEVTVVETHQEASEDVGTHNAGQANANPIEPYSPSMSPKPWPTIPREDRELDLVNPEEDLEELLKLREKVQQRKFIPKQVIVPTGADSETGEDLADELYRREAQRGLGEDEEAFNLEETLAQTTYMWQDKYRPRRPRYFNRVHTGYEWNKYNQTHYDHDNPPPKVVQGYKFNIFYPDLIDKSKAPTYKITKQPDNNETVLLRFIAGPPYEEIAFRIVNREWEYSHKKGFRSKFDRGVLQLHFRFKRHFYRR